MSKGSISSEPQTIILIECDNHLNSFYAYYYESHGENIPWLLILWDKQMFWEEMASLSALTAQELDAK